MEESIPVIEGVLNEKPLNVSFEVLRRHASNVLMQRVEEFWAPVVHCAPTFIGTIFLDVNLVCGASAVAMKRGIGAKVRKVSLNKLKTFVYV